MRFSFHLLKDTFSNIIIAAPVCSTFGVEELIHKVAVKLFRYLSGFAVHLSRTIYKVALPSVPLNKGYFTLGGRLRHNGNKGDTNHFGEVSFRYCSTAR